MKGRGRGDSSRQCARLLQRRALLCIECSSSTTSDRNESPKIEKELGKKPSGRGSFFSQAGTDYSALCSAVLEALKGLNTTKSRLNELHFKNITPCAFVSSSVCVWSECWRKYLANEAAVAIRNRDNLHLFSLPMSLPILLFSSWTSI